MGWRIPFLLSALLVVIGLYLRYRVTESPEFEQAKATDAQKSESASVPIVELFRSSSKEIGLGTLSGIAPLFIQSLLATFALTYAVSDRYGRRPVMLTGVVMGMILIWPMFELISHENPWMMLLGFIIGNPIIQAVMYGPMGAFISEKFTTRTRYTGLSLTYQLTSLIGAGFTPIIAQALLDQAGGGTNTHYIAMLFCVLCAVTGIGVYLSKETATVKQETGSVQARAKEAV